MLTKKKKGERVNQSDTNWKKADVAILILDKMDSKAGTVPEIKKAVST